MTRRAVPLALILVCGALIMLFLGQQYLAERARADALQDRAIQLLDIIDSTRSAALALKEAEAAKREYLLTHDPADRDRYLGFVQSWKDEAGVLRLISSREAFAPNVQKFAGTGEAIVKELESSTAAAGTNASAGTHVFDNLESEVRLKEEHTLFLFTARFQMFAGRFRRRMFLGASLLLGLVVLEAFWIHRMSRTATSNR